MCSCGPPHMANQKQDDQLEHSYSSYVMIRDVTPKTCRRRWMIGRRGERGSGIFVLAARHDDDDDDIPNRKRNKDVNVFGDKLYGKPAKIYAKRKVRTWLTYLSWLMFYVYTTVDPISAGAWQTWSLNHELGERFQLIVYFTYQQVGHPGAYFLIPPRPSHPSSGGLFAHKAMCSVWS